MISYTIKKFANGLSGRPPTAKYKTDYANDCKMKCGIQFKFTCIIHASPSIGVAEQSQKILFYYSAFVVKQSLRDHIYGSLWQGTDYGCCACCHRSQHRSLQNSLKKSISFMKYEFVWTRCFQFSKSISDTYVYVKIRIFRWSVVCIEILDFVCGFRQMFFFLYFQIDSHQRIFERPLKVKFEQQTYFIPRVFSSKILWQKNG
jgi:hypothetical protein